MFFAFVEVTCQTQFVVAGYELDKFNAEQSCLLLYYLVSKVGDHSRGWPEGSLFDSLLHQGVGEGATPFPGLLHFTLDPYLIMLRVKKEASSTIFWVFGMTRPGIEPRSTGRLANTLTARPMSGIYYLVISFKKTSKDILVWYNWSDGKLYWLFYLVIDCINYLII